LAGLTRQAHWSPLYTSNQIWQGAASQAHTQAIYYLLKNRQQEAGLDDFTPHDLRRTAITDLLSAQVDVLTVSAIAGHASADTTRRYDRRSEESKKAAALKLASPFSPEETKLSEASPTSASGADGSDQVQ